MNKINYYSVHFLLAMVFLAGCTTVTVKNQLTFNALVLENRSGSDIESVRVEARNTGAFASCGVILRGTSCSTTFQTKVYQGNSVYISWMLNKQEQLIGPLYVDPPQTIQSDTPAQIVIIFDSESDVTARFVY